MYQAVAAGLAGEVVVAAVERVVVDAAQTLSAASAELCCPLGAAAVCRHCLVERAEPACLDLFAGLHLQVLMGGVLRVWSSKCGRMVDRICVSSCRVRIRTLGTCVMLRMCMRVTLGLCFGFHVDSQEKNSRPVIVYF
jgi:hypothetical protein